MIAAPFYIAVKEGEQMSEAEYRAKMNCILSELGLDHSARSAVIEAKIRDCEDRSYYFGRTIEEEFERDLETSISD